MMLWQALEFRTSYPVFQETPCESGVLLANSMTGLGCKLLNDTANRNMLRKNSIGILQAYRISPILFSLSPNIHFWSFLYIMNVVFIPSSHKEWVIVHILCVQELCIQAIVFRNHLDSAWAFPFLTWWRALLWDHFSLFPLWILLNDAVDSFLSFW